LTNSSSYRSMVH